MLTVTLMITGFVLNAGENLIYNSSFELGRKGYSCHHAVAVASGILDFNDQGMVVDSGVSKYGWQSLRITCSAAQSATLVSSELKLVPGKKYTFSFWGRSDVDNLPVGLGFHSRVQAGKDVETDGRGTNFSLRQDWRRYSFKFTTGKAGQYYQFNISASRTSPGSFWLDGLQLEEGDMTEYHPAAAIETAVYAPEKIIETDKLKGQLCAISYDKTLAGQAVKLTLFDNLLQRQTSEQILLLELPAGKSVTRDFSFDKTRFGGMTIFPAPGVQAASAFFVRLHALPTSSPDGFQLGCNGNFLSSNAGIPGNKGVECLDTVGSPDTLASDRVLLGGFFRVWGTDFTWRYIEPEQGKFVWNRSDRVVAEAEKNHLKLEFTLTDNFCYESQTMRLPDWVKRRDRSGKQEASMLPNCSYKTYLPQLEDWRNYVRAVATRYKGRIAYYDPINEPNVGMSPDVYLEYLQAAYEEIKKVDPAAKVVGLCATEDLGGRATEFMADILRRGGGNFLDVISFHPYGARMDDSSVSAMKRIRQLRKIAQNAGVDKPLWNDESFYLNSMPQGHYMLEAAIPIGAVSRRLLIDMGEGLGASTPLCFDQFFKSPGNPNRLTQFWDMKLQPSEIFAEQNTVAIFLSNAVALKTIELQGDILCYLFKSGNRLLAAIWGKSQEKAFMKFKAPSGVTISSFDLFGNSIQSNSQEISLEIGRLPQYLEWNGSTTEAVAKSIEDAPIRFENDFKVNMVRVLNSNGDARIAVFFKNTSISKADAVKVEVESAFFESRGTVMAAQPVETMNSAIVEVPVRLKTNLPENIDIKIIISNSEKSVERIVSAHVANVIDLSIGRSSPIVKIAKTVLGKVDSPDDLSACFSVEYDANGTLLLNIHVKDDKKCLPGINPYEEDCIEIFIDVFPFLVPDYSVMPNGVKYHDRTYQLTIAPWRDAEHMITSNFANVTAIIKPRPDGYDAKIRIPLRPYLDELSGKMIGLDIAIDDSDSNKRKSQIIWNGTDSNYRDRSVFGVIRFN